jgi:hypothetical protein
MDHSTRDLDAAVTLAQPAAESTHQVKPVPFIQATGCRYILDSYSQRTPMDALCCNAPRMPKSSYCREHHARCYGNSAPADDAAQPRRASRWIARGDP